MTARPRPVPDAASAGYWSAAAARELHLARCSVCAAYSIPPGLVCPLCGSTAPEYTFQPVSGEGVVRSWTTVHQAFLPGFDVPYVLVDVELAEQDGLRMIGRLLDGPGAELRIGLPVKVDFEDLGEGVLVPAFRLTAGAA
jgi:uncharacterized OB-fold protein